MNKPDILHGRYFLPGQAKSCDARLEIIHGRARLIVPDEKIDRPVLINGISDQLGTVPRKIELNDGNVFECSDNDAVNEILDQKRSFFTRVSVLEGSYKYILIATVATIVCLVGFYRYGLPAMVKVAIAVTPAPAITLINNGALETVDQFMFRPSKLSEERKAELTKMFDELVEISGQGDPPFKMVFRASPRIGPNAIALPGGTIILTDELVGLAKSEDEIAGVLAHEIGHVEHQHSLQQLYRAAGIAFMITLIGGDSGQIVEDILGQAALLESFAYTRGYEAEADRHSVEIMVKYDGDPMAFVDLLDRIMEGIRGEKEEGEGGADGDDITSWLSTHPSNANRRKAVEKLIEEQKALAN